VCDESQICCKNLIKYILRFHVIENELILRVMTRDRVLGRGVQRL